MEIYPKDAIESLEFDKILKIISVFASGEEARDKILKIRPVYDFEQISKLNTEVNELKSFRELGNSFEIGTYFAIDECLQQLRISGYVLDIQEIKNIALSITFSSELIAFFTQEVIHHFPTLKNRIKQLINLNICLHSISTLIDIDGRIKINASTVLKSIFKSIHSLERELDNVFTKLKSSFFKKRYLAENVETLRNGRRVFCVLSEHKRKIKGIIHDESASGKTVYVEPNELIEINNRIRDLENEKQKEVYRLLKALSAELAPYADKIKSNHESIVQLDIINAKAVFSAKLQCKLPAIKNRPIFGYKDAYHPLLKWINNKN